MNRDVLNGGFVKLVDRMGSDYSILQAARVSTGSDVVKGDEKDRKLIRYLYRNDHISPFSFVSFQFHVKCPIFVARQWMRHRTFDFNEASARYKSFEKHEFYPQSLRLQDVSDNKQGSNGELEEQLREEALQEVEASYNKSYGAYESLISSNVAREQARMVMPVGQYTEFFAHITLRNLFHFLDLRLDSHAQEEIRVYAEAILSILEEIDDLKWSVEVYKDMRQLKQQFQGAVNKAFRGKSANIEDLKTYLEEF